MNRYYFLILGLCIYIVLNFLLVFFKVKAYQYNLSSLIGIWDGFHQLNPGYVLKDFVVYKDGGYDGQFFFFISEYLYNDFKLPILDAFYLRFNRVGLSLLVGGLSKIIGFDWYPVLALTVLHFFHILSFWLLYISCKEEYRKLSFFYLFSPFVINSNLLLVSDSLFASFSIISFYLVERAGLNIFFEKEYNSKNGLKNTMYLFLAVTSLVFLVLIRETALSVILFLFVLSIYRKDYKFSFLFLLPILFYYSFTLIAKQILQPYAGTNPLSYTQLIDFPFVGFFKSILEINFRELKLFIRSISKIPIFVYYIILIFGLWNIRKSLYTKEWEMIIYFIPLVFIIFLAGISEQGYWLSFDNISRMFMLTTPLVVIYHNRFSNYKSYSLLFLNVIILALVVVRYILVKDSMSYFIYND